MTHRALDRALRFLQRCPPYLLFLPFGLAYVALVLVLRAGTLYGDETRYLQFAHNLLHGSYSPPPPAINLWNGPGYPLILAPLVWLGASHLAMAAMNGVFQYLSVVFLFKTVRVYNGFNISLAVALAWACYYPAYLWEMPLIFTESFTSLLVIGWVYALARERTVVAGLLLGYLVLTKIAFGYVLLGSLVIWGTYALFSKVAARRKLLPSLVVALGLTVPYLAYTWSLTGRLFYWGNSGGMSLYWMSTPFADEHGDWQGNGLFEAALKHSPMMQNHGKELERIRAMKGVERDQAYTRAALANIKAHPGKYLKNVIANISRLLIDTPYYFAPPTDMYLFRVLPVIFLLPVMFLALALMLVHWPQVPPALQLSLIWFALYFGESTLVSAYHRQFYVMMPALLAFAGYVHGRFIHIRLGAHRAAS